MPASNPHEIVVTAVGDVMLGTTFPDDSGGGLPPNDGADVLREVAPVLKLGDVVFGNLEGPLIDGGESSKCRHRVNNCYAFRVPTRYGNHLKDAGFRIMGLANNHAMDFGAAGRASSRAVLESLGIAHSGEVGDLARINVKGRQVELIAFATYPGANNLNDLEAALEAIKAARAESDFLIVSFHGGAEGASHQHVPAGDETFLGEDRGDLRRFAHAAIDAGANLVIGHGPHVVRGLEVYRGRLIAYSLGNFATYGPFNLNGENGMAFVLEAHLALDGTFLGGRLHPIRQIKPGGPRLDPEMAIVPIVRDLTRADFRENGVKIGMRGELWPPSENVPGCSEWPELLRQALGSGRCDIFPLPFSL
ncbi:MAG TPA: CapA family protein [Candidatus Saccharimonadales bacterium]|nr:CapA family protein [Candidatus Saccharimonadales bacterium]